MTGSPEHGRAIWRSGFIEAIWAGAILAPSAAELCPSESTLDGDGAHSNHYFRLTLRFTEHDRARYSGEIGALFNRNETGRGTEARDRIGLTLADLEHDMATGPQQPRRRGGQQAIGIEPVGPADQRRQRVMLAD